jgi:UDP-3-O-[3-hydroxymyristoyl] glucosamine N-acyltransferase
MQAQTDNVVLTTGELAERIGAKLIGEGSAQVTGVNAVGQAGPTEVCFVADQKHAAPLAGAKVAGVIVSERMDKVSVDQLVVDNVQISVIDALNLFAPKLTPISGIHATAVVEETAVIAGDVAVGPRTYIGHNVRVGSGSVIADGCSIGENSIVGQNCRLDPSVVIYHNCKIGDNCIIQANATIGATGFGYYCIDGRHKLVPHNGGVIIEDCVEIGANCCVDRAKFGNTIIGAGTKIDNCVQIAHNVIVGKCCLLAAQVGIGGSSQIGNGVVLAGQAGVADHIRIGDGAMVGGGSAVIRDVPAGQQFWGMPARELKLHLKSISALKRLPKMTQELKEVSKRVKNLETAKDNKQ